MPFINSITDPTSSPNQTHPSRNSPQQRRLSSRAQPRDPQLLFGIFICDQHCPRINSGGGEEIFTTTQQPRSLQTRVSRREIPRIAQRETLGPDHNLPRVPEGRPKPARSLKPNVLRTKKRGKREVQRGHQTSHFRLIPSPGIITTTVIPTEVEGPAVALLHIPIPQLPTWRPRTLSIIWRKLSPCLCIDRAQLF